MKQKSQIGNLMQHIDRHYQNLAHYLKKGKVLLIYGARQIGKTTLLTSYLESCGKKWRCETGDNIVLQNFFHNASVDQICEFAAGYEIVAIDEAQRIPNIGQSLKIMVDHVPGIQVIATGSSSFALAGQVGEPLTGRKRTLTMYPIAQIELAKDLNPFDLKQQLESFLVYGMYPEVIMADRLEDKRNLVMEITESYLLKDILELDKVKRSKGLIDLLRLLAFQVGSEVSFAELGQKVMMDAKTVARYLDLLEKSFVIYNLRGYSRNLRKEINKKSKYYFYDNGIRNALIANFNELALRNDVGQLWENFLMMERIKSRTYTDMLANDYFWRTWDQQEIDLVEERSGQLFGYEFKWGDKTPSAPKDWLNTYPEAHYTVINKASYFDFVTRPIIAS